MINLQDTGKLLCFHSSGHIYGLGPRLRPVVDWLMGNDVTGRESGMVGGRLQAKARRRTVNLESREAKPKRELL